jgi:integrase
MSGWLWQLPDGRWRIRWRTPSGRRPSETYRTKQAAERALRKHVDDAERGLELPDRRRTLREFVPEWEAATKPAVKPRSWEAYDQHVRSWILPLLGDQRLIALDQRACQRFVDRLSTRGLAPKTTRCIYGTLSLILRMAAGYGMCRPVERVRLPRVERSELLIPIPEQVEQLAGAIDPRLWALVRLCAYTGLRQGEALALQPADVDWLRRRIRVGGTLNLRTQRRESPKSGRGRWVTMPTVVADSLAAHLQAHPPSDYIFHRADGRPWKASRVWEAWNDARKACKLEEVDFHHLRHCAASLMIRAGWSAKRVQVELGHADPAFTLRVYGHLWPDEIDSGRAQLDALLAGPHLAHDARAAGLEPLQ